ncbi:hypothetical protein EVAR_77476_1 [Eumeta japonica]|uniref:Uncharacterized protein n=1 Tax=Eumeta variegata TaxID=151549 RepID=A0A4C1T689_EUMVA|nr:hypothetical protein EVAR_77125_1 [Eumeta japonica]GBP10029.1 hypothetical protein EVAR_77476_1 [Eumeta japonica]
MATAFGQLTNALGQRQSHPTPKEDDECDLYAKLLSTKLRELSKDERKLVMYEIDGIFVNKIKSKLYRRETPSPKYSNSYYRPPTGSTSYAQSETNIHIPNRPSSALTSHSEPITYAYASKQPVQFSSQPPSVESCNTPETETIRKSNIINIALLNSFEEFESEAS